ncbi:hypothetical protein QJS04_geneDACA004259 [Acorus gramineus]|uniref:Uncharacterized protein n=1 Tax=Acorus gramineus TaxID=55184 RepID=A0AAV9B1P1_ACOGR|nr:hypothetical protein QJS04_geneDACA004259 [Acorus gramineus]
MSLSLLQALLLIYTDLLFNKLSFALPLQQNTHFEQAAQSVPMGRRPFNMIFHPPTTSCVLRKSYNDPLKLGPCTSSDMWTYTPQNFLFVKGTYYCLQAVGPGQPAKLSILCTPSDSQWEMVSDTKSYMETKTEDGQTFCLDVDADNTIITNPCKSLTHPGGFSSDSQWFSIVTQSGDQNSREVAEVP